jgi:DNA segregation ATPase FtsK/SpoIIIE-like protein
MTPVVVDPKQAANALRSVREMEERYKTLAAVGVQISSSNRNIRAALAEDRRPTKARR